MPKIEQLPTITDALMGIIKRLNIFAGLEDSDNFQYSIDGCRATETSGEVDGSMDVKMTNGIIECVMPVAFLVQLMQDPIGPCFRHMSMQISANDITVNSPSDKATQERTFNTLTDNLEKELNAFQATPTLYKIITGSDSIPCQYQWSFIKKYIPKNEVKSSDEKPLSTQTANDLANTNALKLKTEIIEKFSHYLFPTQQCRAVEGIRLGLIKEKVEKNIAITRNSLLLGFDLADIKKDNDSKDSVHPKKFEDYVRQTLKDIQQAKSDVTKIPPYELTADHVKHFGEILLQSCRYNAAIKIGALCLQLDSSYHKIGQDLKAKACRLQDTLSVDKTIIKETSNISGSVIPDAYEMANGKVTVVYRPIEDAYYKRGKAWLNKSRYIEALMDLTTAMGLGQKNSNSFLTRAHAWYSMAEMQEEAIIKATTFTQAIADATVAITSDDKLARAYHIRGMAFFKQKEYKKSLIDLADAAGRDDTYFNSFENHLKQYAKILIADSQPANSDEAKQTIQSDELSVLKKSREIFVDLELHTYGLNKPHIIKTPVVGWLYKLEDEITALSSSNVAATLTTNDLAIDSGPTVFAQIAPLPVVTNEKKHEPTTAASAKKDKKQKRKKKITPTKISEPVKTDAKPITETNETITMPKTEELSTTTNDLMGALMGLTAATAASVLTATPETTDVSSSKLDANANTTASTDDQTNDSDEDNDDATAFAQITPLGAEVKLSVPMATLETTGVSSSKDNNKSTPIPFINNETLAALAKDILEKLPIPIKKMGLFADTNNTFKITPENFSVDSCNNSSASISGDLKISNGRITCIMPIEIHVGFCINNFYHLRIEIFKQDIKIQIHTKVKTLRDKVLAMFKGNLTEQLQRYNRDSNLYESLLSTDSADSGYKMSHFGDKVTPIIKCKFNYKIRFESAPNIVVSNTKTRDREYLYPFDAAKTSTDTGEHKAKTMSKTPALSAEAKPSEPVMTPEEKQANTAAASAKKSKKKKTKKKNKNVANEVVTQATTALAESKTSESLIPAEQKHPETPPVNSTTIAPPSETTPSESVVTREEQDANTTAISAKKIKKQKHKKKANPPKKTEPAEIDSTSTPEEMQNNKDESKAKPDEVTVSAGEPQTISTPPTSTKEPAAAPPTVVNTILTPVQTEAPTKIQTRSIEETNEKKATITLPIPSTTTTQLSQAEKQKNQVDKKVIAHKQLPLPKEQPKSILQNSGHTSSNQQSSHTTHRPTRQALLPTPQSARQRPSLLASPTTTSSVTKIAPPPLSSNSDYPALTTKARMQPKPQAAPLAQSHTQALQPKFKPTLQNTSQPLQSSVAPVNKPNTQPKLTEDKKQDSYVQILIDIVAIKNDDEAKTVREKLKARVSAIANNSLDRDNELVKTTIKEFFFGAVSWKFNLLHFTEFDEILFPELHAALAKDGFGSEAIRAIWLSNKLKEIGNNKVEQYLQVANLIAAIIAVDTFSSAHQSWHLAHSTSAENINYHSTVANIHLNQAIVKSIDAESLKFCAASLLDERNLCNLSEHAKSLIDALFGVKKSEEKQSVPPPNPTVYPASSATIAYPSTSQTQAVQFVPQPHVNPYMPPTSTQQYLLQLLQLQQSQIPMQPSVTYVPSQVYQQPYPQNAAAMQTPTPQAFSSASGIRQYDPRLFGDSMSKASNTTTSSTAPKAPRSSGHPILKPTPMR